MANLAVNGGAPALPDGLKSSPWPVFDDAERRAMLDVLESGAWCSMSDGKVAEFQEAFADYVGTKHAAAVPTGTAALELAFRAVGIEPGDEVIVPAVTFVASASAIVLANGVPVFVDVDPETYQISPDAVEAAITDRTRAIEPVHYGGYPADMDRITEIAGKHDLFVIEDCAEAHGSEWRGKRVGSLGDIGCFSFQMGKPLTCGEGGAITYSNDELATSCYAYARLGRKPGGEKYKHYVPAGNYRMSQFLGALLLAQLTRLEEQTEIRHENGEYLAAELEKLEGISALKRDPRITKRGYYFYFMKYEASRWNDVHRDKFIKALSAEGVGCGTAHNAPIYQNPAFGQIKRTLLHGSDMDYSKVHCPEAERIYESEVVAMGRNFLMERENVGRIVAAVSKLRDNIDELSKQG